MTLLLDIAILSFPIFNRVYNQSLMSVETLERIQLQNSRNLLAHWEISEWMSRSVSTTKVEGHSLKCCKVWAMVQCVPSWHSWWRCLKWIRSLVRSTDSRPLQMVWAAAISGSLGCSFSPHHYRHHLRIIPSSSVWSLVGPHIISLEICILCRTNRSWNLSKLISRTKEIILNKWPRKSQSLKFEIPIQWALS